MKGIWPHTTVRVLPTLPRNGDDVGADDFVGGVYGSYADGRDECGIPL